MTNLRGKHKQIYSLAVKEVDPQVNWEALVEEKLVRPGLQLVEGMRGPGDPHCLSGVTVQPGRESCSQCFLIFVSMT